MRSGLCKPPKSLNTLCMWERSLGCRAITYVSRHRIFQHWANKYTKNEWEKVTALGMKVVNLFECNVHSSGRGRRTGVGCLVSVTCWVKKCLKRKKRLLCSCGDVVSPSKYGFLNCWQVYKQSLHGLIWSLQEVIDFNYGSAEVKCELEVLEKWKAHCSWPK